MDHNANITFQNCRMYRLDCTESYYHQISAAHRPPNVEPVSHGWFRSLYFIVIKRYDLSLYLPKYVILPFYLMQTHSVLLCSSGLSHILENNTTYALENEPLLSANVLTQIVTIHKRKMKKLYHKDQRNLVRNEYSESILVILQLLWALALRNNLLTGDNKVEKSSTFTK